MTSRDIEKSICREMSGDLEQGMLAVGRCPGPSFPTACLLGLTCTGSFQGAHHPLVEGQGVQSKNHRAQAC